MNPKYKVIWTNVAENDFKAIIDFISIDNPQNALKTLKSIKQKASNLYALPERGRIEPELHGQGILQYREPISKRFGKYYFSKQSRALFFEN